MKTLKNDSVLAATVLLTISCSSGDQPDDGAATSANPEVSEMSTDEPTGCVGDYVYKPNEYEVGFGIRVRRDPDTVKAEFVDYSGFDGETIRFKNNTVFFYEEGSGTSAAPWVLNCDSEPFLYLPDLSRPKNIFDLRKVEGSIFEVAEREDWRILSD